MYETLKEGAICWDEKSALGDSIIKLRAIKIMDQEGNIRSHFFSKSKINVQLDFTIYKLDSDLVIGFDITNDNGVTILRTYHNDSQSDNWPGLKVGDNSLICELPGDFFNSGTFYICPKISLHFKKWIINSDPLLSFDIEINHGVSPFWNRINKSNRPGSLAMILPWFENEKIG